MQRFMDLEQEWLQLAAERYYLLEEQKEESNCLHRSQFCDLFFYGSFLYFILGSVVKVT